jgi:hypothetical protein
MIGLFEHIVKIYITRGFHHKSGLQKGREVATVNKNRNVNISKASSNMV